LRFETGHNRYRWETGTKVIQGTAAGYGWQQETDRARAVCQWKPTERTRTTAEVITDITLTTCIIQSTVTVLKVK